MSDPQGREFHEALLDAGYVRDHVLAGLRAGQYGISFRFSRRWSPSSRRVPATVSSGAACARRSCASSDRDGCQLQRRKRRAGRLSQRTGRPHLTQCTAAGWSGRVPAGARKCIGT